MKILYIQSADRKWYWQILSGNGKIVADSGSFFRTLRQCKISVERIVTFLTSYDVVFEMPEVVQTRPAARRP